jgi:hypothetical protein
MTSTQRQRISKQLEEARLLQEGILRNPDIASRLTTFGVDSAEMAEGQRLYGTASDSVTSQDRMGAEQKAATVALWDAQETAYSHYTLVSEVARAATGSNKTQLALLGITGVAPRTVAALLARGKALLNGVATHPELASLLARYGQDSAALTHFQGVFDALADANAAQQSAKGAAQYATAQQGEALKNLALWVSKIRRLARAAFRGEPQQLEKLGITAR